MNLPTLVCAWCEEVLREGDGEEDRASHGICEDCMERHFPAEAAMIAEMRQAAA